MDKEQEKCVDEIISLYQQRVDFLSRQKVRKLEELLRRAKELKARRLSEKIKN